MANDREYSWDDTIVNDEPEFVLLPDGEYEYEVKSFERQRYQGSAKENGLPPCNMAILNLEIKNDKGLCSVRERLYLHSRCEGLLSAFFVSIGQKKKGEKLAMDWNKVVGAKGRCKLGHREYNGEKYNQVTRFLPPDENASNKTYTPGRF